MQFCPSPLIRMVAPTGVKFPMTAPTLLRLSLNSAVLRTNRRFQIRVAVAAWRDRHLCGSGVDSDTQTKVIGCACPIARAQITSLDRPALLA